MNEKSKIILTKVKSYLQKENTNSNSSLGIICLCTGNYHVFFQGFYDSFRQNFAPECNKTFYVFTDNENIGNDKEDVVMFPIENLPWPLVTLLRFNYIINNKEQFENNQYLAFCNINLICNEVISLSDIAPKKSEKEKMTYVLHPWYANKDSDEAPFDRNNKSLAHIKWGTKADYVMGSFFLGNKNDFLSLCETLKNNIEQDLKHNVIARYHDESHLNEYASKHKPYRVLNPSYMYPEESTWVWGERHLYTNKITYLDKRKYFDVDSFKGKSLINN